MRPHKCELCGDILSRSTKLTEHLRTHTGEKPHKCSKCNIFFNRTSDKDQHERTHGDEYEYHCDGEGCGYRTRRKGDLKRHLKRKDAWQCRRGNAKEIPPISESVDGAPLSVSSTASQSLRNTSDVITELYSSQQSRDTISVLPGMISPIYDATEEFIHFKPWSFKSSRIHTTVDADPRAERRRRGGRA